MIVLLIDTYNTLNSGLPNALKVFKKYAKKIIEKNQCVGVRLDSGDLKYLAMECIDRIIETMNIVEGDADQNYYKVLQKAKVILTNDLDEYLINDIKAQIIQECLDLGKDPKIYLDRIIWAAGTKPGTCWDQPALGGVMKVVEVDESPRIKVAEDAIKCSIPGWNRSLSVYDKNNKLVAIAICDHKEIYDAKDEGVLIIYDKDDETKESYFHADEFCWKVRQIDWKKSKWKDETVEMVRDRVKVGLGELDSTNLRINNAHLMKVGLTKEVFYKRQSLKEELR